MFGSSAQLRAIAEVCGSADSRAVVDFVVARVKVASDRIGSGRYRLIGSFSCCAWRALRLEQRASVLKCKEDCWILSIRHFLAPRFFDTRRTSAKFGSPNPSN
jgi:hypothetical protein